MAARGGGAERELATTQLQAHGLSREQAQALTDRMRALTIEAGAPLLTYGQAHDTLYLLVTGRLRVTLPMDGGELELGKVQAGHWVGELHLIDGGPSTASLSAVEECSLLAIDHELLDALEVDEPAATSQLLTLIARDLATRLRRTSTGLVQKSGDTWRLASPPERRSWLSQAIAWLQGGEA